jgi:hypothetical protein
VIQLLIRKYPKACELKDIYGCLLLHLACAGNASLSVIQLLVQQWPDALNITDNKNRKPLDWAKKPDEYKIPNKETIAWLENYVPTTFKHSTIIESVHNKSNNQLELSNKYESGTDLLQVPVADKITHQITKVFNEDSDQFLEDRSKLRDTIHNRTYQAVVSEQYIEHIVNRNETLGAGYFGKVYLGIDDKLNKKFAIKTINNDILTTNGAPSIENVQKIISTFHKEQQVSWRSQNCTVYFTLFF